MSKENENGNDMEKSVLSRYHGSKICGSQQ